MLVNVSDLAVKAINKALWSMCTYI